MEPREYLDARWHALVRAAVGLGVPEEDAPAVVQRVLASNERRIRRAEDPDPLVHQALRDAVLGPPPAPARRRRGPAMLAVAAALVVVGIGVALTRPFQPPPDRLDENQVPSLFGYDGAAAQKFLEGRGLDVTLEPLRACEVMDRVVATSPAAGTPYHRGDDIVVFTSVPADVECLTNYTDRESAWQLLDFANGRGPAPPFADHVSVYAGGPPAVLLTGSEAADPESWRALGVFALLRDASAQVALLDDRPLTYSLPAIRVTQATDGVGSCGVPDPSVAGTADAFALVIRPPGGRGCGVRVEVYRFDGLIEAVVLYPVLDSSSAPSS